MSICLSLCEAKVVQNAEYRMQSQPYWQAVSEMLEEFIIHRRGAGVEKNKPPYCFQKNDI